MTPAQRRYRDYLQSPHWRRMRTRILNRAQEHCERCGYFCGPVEMLDPVELDERIEVLIERGAERCEVCGYFCHLRSTEDNSGRVWLEVHHLTYERLGCERDDDLVALCCYCHDDVTEREQYRALVRQVVPSLPRDASHAMVLLAVAQFWADRQNAGRARE